MRGPDDFALSLLADSMAGQPFRPPLLMHLAMASSMVLARATHSAPGQQCTQWEVHGVGVGAVCGPGLCRARAVCGGLGEVVLESALRREVRHPGDEGALQVALRDDISADARRVPSRATHAQ